MKRKHSDISEFLTKMPARIIDEENMSPDPNECCAVCGCVIEDDTDMEVSSVRPEVCDKCSGLIHLESSAFEGKIAAYRICCPDNRVFGSVEEYIKINDRTIIMLLTTQAQLQGRLKVTTEMSLTLTQVRGMDEADSLMSETKHFTTAARVVTQTISLLELCEDFTVALEKKLEEYQEQYGYCEIENVNYLEILICNYPFATGSCYIHLPHDVEVREAVTNIKNFDEASFAWSIISGLFHAKHDATRQLNYPAYQKFLNLDGIECPVPIDAIPKFERQNDISVNVYTLLYDNKKKEHRLSGPIYYSKNKKMVHVNLLYLQDGTRFHYCRIDDIGKLIESRFFDVKNYCDACLVHFTSSESLKAHHDLECTKMCTLLPSDKSGKIHFNRWNKTTAVPFVVYADSESIIKPLMKKESNAAVNNCTMKTQHVALSFAYYVKCAYDDTLTKYQAFRGPDCAKLFIKQLTKDAKSIYKFLQAEQHHKQNPVVIPVFFHNMSKYDLHQFIKELAFDDNKIHIVPETSENYVAVSKLIPVGMNDEGKKIFIDLQFRDSYRFQRQSLDKLAQLLHSSQMKETRKRFPEHIHFQLMRRKGVFPYSYVKTFESLDETMLPSREMFYDELNQCDISDNDYKHAWQVWTVFECKTLGEYSDLYLQSDVMLLTDIFETYRELCIKTFDLDPCHYISASGFSWDIVLKCTDVHLDYLHDMDMVNFIKRGLRSDLALSCTRFARANNHYMPREGPFRYQPDQQTSYLVHWDVNNVDAWTLTQYMPTGKFQWLSEREINNLDIYKIPDDYHIGYILEVDLEYNEHLHDDHNELPFCPDMMVPPVPTSKKKKLIANLFDKRNYVIHYRNLKQALSHGLRLSKIHRVLRFEQSPWMRNLVARMLHLADTADSEFEQHLYESLVHSVCYKLTSFNKNFPNIRLVTTWKNSDRPGNCRHWIFSPTYEKCSIFAENLVAIELHNTETSYRKPIYLGFCISELSKWAIYDFHYNFVKRKYDKNSCLLHIEANTLIYQIVTEDIYKDMQFDYQTFDCTREGYRHNALRNLDVLRKVKDMKGGKIILTFVGLKPKMYAYNSEDKDVKKAGYTKKNIIESRLSMDSYIRVLQKNVSLVIQQDELVTEKHCIYSRSVNRVALSTYNDTRCIFQKMPMTYAWGHRFLKEYFAFCKTT